MKILHVTLGNPRTHIGGLSRYCIDLREQQIKDGHNVKVLYAGAYTLRKRIKIRKKSSGYYALEGALPVPITYGISCPQRYICEVDRDVYRKWLIEEKFDIVHVHSIMGIHKEFFESAEDCNIPMIFTTHDYYPCCFRCNLVDNQGKLCIETFQAEKCAKCNANAGLSQKMQILMQSELYQAIKSNKIVGFIKQQYTKKTSVIKAQEAVAPEVFSKIEDYERLHNYYGKIMNKFSVIHCNSIMTNRIYESHFPALKYQVIPITHAEIVHRGHSRKSEKKLHISYLGGMSKHKGYEQIKEVVTQLSQTTEKWELSLYGGEFTEQFDDNRVKLCGTFSKDQEEVIWENTDLLLVPSQWPETFGFAVLEALAREIPVICSDLVGASYLLETLKDKCVYHADDSKMLAGRVKNYFDYKYYIDVQSEIKKINISSNMEGHSREILKVYLEAMK